MSLVSHPGVWSDVSCSQPCGVCRYRRGVGIDGWVPRVGCTMVGTRW